MISRLCLAAFLLLTLSHVCSYRLHARMSLLSDVHSTLTTLPSSVPFHRFSFSQYPLLLADTSVSEEDVLDVTGRVSELPNPLIVIGLAAVIFLGVAFLQFSLGDLTTEEGQARVRDFLATRRETERKRGYFDD